jgi:hypothetical protein
MADRFAAAVAASAMLLLCYVAAVDVSIACFLTALSLMLVSIRHSLALPPR